MTGWYDGFNIEAEIAACVEHVEECAHLVSSWLRAWAIREECDPYWNALHDIGGEG